MRPSLRRDGLRRLGAERRRRRVGVPPDIRQCRRQQARGLELRRGLHDDLRRPRRRRPAGAVGDKYCHVPQGARGRLGRRARGRREPRRYRRALRVRHLATRHRRVRREQRRGRRAQDRRGKHGGRHCDRDGYLLRPAVGRGADEPLESEGSDRVRRRGHLRREVHVRHVRRLPGVGGGGRVRDMFVVVPGHVRQGHHRRRRRHRPGRDALRGQRRRARGVRRGARGDRRDQRQERWLFRRPATPHEAAALDRGVPKLRRQRRTDRVAVTSCNSRGLDRARRHLVRQVRDINHQPGLPGPAGRPPTSRPLGVVDGHARQRSISIPEPRPAEQLRAHRERRPVGGHQLLWLGPDRRRLRGLGLVGPGRGADI
mmetsp:Transcript_9193/g.26917  ORF Transcript_9193/g.26917 Transcript_9193/m.26917 type:complete len:371 (-) Transcript_9193:2047-3159(-)